MISPTAAPLTKRTHLALLVILCLILPITHTTTLASQVVIPREFLLYLYTALFVLFLSQLGKLRYNTFFTLALIFLAWQALSLVWSTDYSAGIEEVLNFYVFLLSAFVLYQIREKRLRNLLLNSLIFSISLAALIGIEQNFNWNLLDIYQAAIPASTFNNKNLAASASLLFLPIIFAQLLTSNRRQQQLLYSIAATLTLSFILVSHTKGVWLAGLCLLFITLLAYMRTHINAQQEIRKRLFTHRVYLSGIVLLSLVIFIMPGALNTGKMKLETYTLASNSAMVRIGFYVDAAPLFMKHPIAGVGSGSLRREFRAEPGGNYSQQHAEKNKYLFRLHNDHLQYLVEHGLVGLILWLVILFILFKRSSQQIRDANTTFTDKMAIYALLLGVLGMLIHAMFSFPLRSVSTGSLFWMLIGLLLSYRNEQKIFDIHGTQAIVKYPIIAAMLMVTVFAINNVTHRAIGSYYIKQAEEGLSSGYCFAAKLYLNYLLEAVNLDLRSAQLLALTYDYCGGDSPEQNIERMDRILAFEPNHALALLVKADANYRLGDIETAYNLYLHAERVNPQEPRTYLGVAKIAAASNRTAEAIEQIKQALLIDSENKKAKEMLKVLESR